MICGGFPSPRFLSPFAKRRVFRTSADSPFAVRSGETGGARHARRIAQSAMRRQGRLCRPCPQFTAKP